MGSSKLLMNICQGSPLPPPSLSLTADGTCLFQAPGPLATGHRGYLGQDALAGRAGASSTTRSAAAGRLCVLRGPRQGRHM